MASINPFINFNGNAEEAFTFYASAFGTKIGSIVRMKELDSPDFPIPAEDAEKIMRITLPIGNSVLIANDVPFALGPVSENENRSKIAVSVETRDEADKIFAVLSQGATVEMPFDTSPWGSTFTMFRDKYGIEWTIEVAQG